MHSKPGTSHFDLAAQEWDQLPISQQLGQLPQRLMQVIPLQKDQHLLDFGAGTGLLAAALAPQVKHITALDTSASMLQVLAAKNLANVSTVCHDITAGLPDIYDGVISCMALHHVQDIASTLQIFKRHLSRNAFLALIDLYQEDGSFHGDNEGKGVKHFGFAPDLLKQQAIAAGFDHIVFQEILQIKHENGRFYPLFLMTAQARKSAD